MSAPVSVADAIETLREELSARYHHPGMMVALKALIAAAQPYSDKEEAAITELMADRDLSRVGVLRQALRTYQADHAKRKAGETCVWSGDAARAAEFAGKPIPEPRRLVLDLDMITSRFLAWKLPDDFAPDGGISFVRVGNEGTVHEYRYEPTGTNLLNYTQARAMIEDILKGAAIEESPAKAALHRANNRPTPTDLGRLLIRAACQAAPGSMVSVNVEGPDAPEDAGRVVGNALYNMEANGLIEIKPMRSSLHHMTDRDRELMAWTPNGAQPVVKPIDPNPMGIGLLTHAAQNANLERLQIEWPLGMRVRKRKGSSWKGRVVGYYTTMLTPLGIAVESATETGSVQIYPITAMEAWHGE